MNLGQLLPVFDKASGAGEKVKELIGTNFIEIYVKSSLEELIKRDTKGLYKQSLNKEIYNLIGFPGSEIPYEEPKNPDITLYADKESLEDSTSKLYNYITKTLT